MYLLDGAKGIMILEEIDRLQVCQIVNILVRKYIFLILSCNKEMNPFLECYCPPRML